MSGLVLFSVNQPLLAAHVGAPADRVTSKSCVCLRKYILAGTALCIVAEFCFIFLENDAQALQMKSKETFR